MIKILIASDNLYFINGVVSFLDDDLSDLENRYLITVESCNTFCDELYNKYDMLILDFPHMTNFSCHNFKCTRVLTTKGLTLTALSNIVRNCKTKKNTISFLDLMLSILSQQERNIFLLVIRGYSQIYICRKLNISYKTLCTHLRNIRLKYGLKNRLQVSGLIAILKNYNCSTLI